MSTLIGSGRLRRWRRAVGVAVQSLTFLPDFCLLNTIRGLVKMWGWALSALAVVLTPTLTRIRIMPKPICATLLIWFQILNV